MKSRKHEPNQPAAQAAAWKPLARVTHVVNRVKGEIDDDVINFTTNIASNITIMLVQYLRVASKAPANSAIEVCFKNISLILIGHIQTRFISTKAHDWSLQFKVHLNHIT